MSWIGLEKPQTGRVIRTNWGVKVVEALDILHDDHAVDYSGSIHRDLAPDEDLLYSIGKPNARVREVHSGYGYFSYEIFIRGKRVIKDEDPINIADIFDTAVEKIRTAIDRSGYIQRLGGTLNVDTLSTERTESGTIEGITDDGYRDIVKPSAGKRISTRGWLLHTDATSGVIKMFFRDSGKLVGVLFASKQGMITNNRANITGYENEPVRVSWSGLSVNSNIFYQITFKEV